MLGKLTTDQLEKYIFQHLEFEHPAVLKRAAIGEDCSLIDLNDDLLVVTSDPITGSDASLGALAVNVNLNDLATTGCSPIGLMLTILAPPNTPLEVISQLMASASATAQQYQTEIIGGHTEYTTAVNKIVISAVALGQLKKSAVLDESSIKPGDAIVMTKTAGLEGTAILAYQHRGELTAAFGSKMVEEAIALFEQTNVVRDGLIAAEQGVLKMHDVTEGGLLGAVWEICQATKCGCYIDGDRIAIANVTAILTRHFDIDPLRLISSGAMLMIVKKEDVDGLISALHSASINAQMIGQLTDVKEGCILYDRDETRRIEPPKGDALYEVNR